LLNSKYLVKLYGCCSHEGKYYIVTELAENLSLEKYMKRMNEQGYVISEDWKISAALDICKGIKDLHDNFLGL